MSHKPRGAVPFFLALLFYAAYSFVWSPTDWKFTNNDLRKKIAKLYTDEKLGDPKELLEQRS